MKILRRKHQKSICQNNIFIDIDYSKEFHKCILFNILNELDNINYRYNIYIVNYGNNVIGIYQNQNLYFMSKNSYEYKELLSTSKYIIGNSETLKNFYPKNTQHLLNICILKNEKSNFVNTQRLCRLSCYNVFQSKSEGELYLQEYGLNFILKNPKIIYDFQIQTDGLMNLLLNDDVSKVDTFDELSDDNVLIYVDKIINTHQEKLVFDYLQSLDLENNYFILTPNTHFSLLHKLNKRVGYIIYSKSYYTFIQKIILKLCLKFTLFETIFNKQSQHYFKNAINKKLKGLKFNKIIVFLDASQYTCHEIFEANCPVEYLDINENYIGVKCLQKIYLKNQLFKKKFYHNTFVIDNLSYDLENKDNIYNLSVQFQRYFSYLKKSSNCVKGSIYFRYKSLLKFDINQCELYLGNIKIKHQVKKGILFYKLSFIINNNDIIQLPAQNKFFLSYCNPEGFGFRKDINYAKNHWYKRQYLKSKILNIDGKTSCYLRQSLKNRLYLTVRPHNYTDHFIENLKINFAYYLSCLLPKKNLYILYEKDSSRYEESASVLYENLIDRGYTNAYFILDKNYQDRDKIKLKYKANIIDKYSFKHYFYFFKSPTFLGSELLVHSMELRIMNKYVLKKIHSDAVNYVFLQHGVMYMISLDSDSRKYFTPRKDGKGKFRVVTSSHEEARHFTELGGYSAEQIIICGLPKYDRNILYSDADKIVIMPTWRPWEYNQATTDFKKTNYYLMLQRIFDGIDEQYRDKIIILPHPLFYKAAQQNDFELKEYMHFNVKYDEILRSTRILITDYSSIAYDAFYRGSRVIFYWEELKDSLQNYGINTKLMLNEDNVFGDICYDNEDLKNVLVDNYDNKQKEHYQERYQNLVEFQDSHNTERLIQYLKEEKIL